MSPVRKSDGNSIAYDRLCHFSSNRWPTSPCGALPSTGLPYEAVALRSFIIYLLPPVTHFYLSLLSLSVQLSTYSICCLVQRSTSWLPHFLSTTVYRAANVLFQCFLLALSLLSFCPWHWLSLLIPPLRFRTLDISIMREALVKSGGTQTPLDSGRR